jgi:hypothetical protein
MRWIDKKRNNRHAKFTDLLNSPRCSDDSKKSRVLPWFGFTIDWLGG